MTEPGDYYLTTEQRGTETDTELFLFGHFQLLHYVLPLLGDLRKSRSQSEVSSGVGRVDKSRMRNAATLLGTDSFFLPLESGLFSILNLVEILYSYIRINIQ
jgi:hypothetical protein